MTGSLAESLVVALRREHPRVAGPHGKTWRRADLLSLAQVTADRLAARLVHPAEPVHVTIGNRPEDLGTLLGVWLAGAVAVPVHRSASAMTVSGLQQTAQARFSIDAGELVDIAGAAPQRRDLLADAALVLFTSGSTGRPKGVVLGHAQLAGKIAVLGRLLDLRQGDVVIVPLQLTFVFGIWVSLLTLLAGARLILMPRFSREVVADQLGRGATILAAVPSMLRMLAAKPPPAAPALRAIFSGGESLGTALPGAIGEAWPDAGIFDLYGLTETGSCDFCLTPSDQPQGIGTIGRPTERVGFRLIAKSGATVDVGSPGELQIATPFKMLGYLDDPALTEASFHDGFFGTGDLARLRVDGRVELVGRIKAIISRGGNKIAPLEIENLFGSHPDVAGVLCTGIADGRLGEAVHVMIVPRVGAALDADLLRRWAAPRTERYKLPDGIHFSNSLPVGASGKADRAALARMITEARRTSNGTDRGQPRGGRQKGAKMSVLDRFRLTGKRLFITGGSRGLGREMALAIADASADVALTGRDAESLERTAADIRALGRQAWTIQADMGDPGICERACGRALAAHGPFDILINNVGGRRDPAPIRDMTVARWRELMDLNLTSAFACTKVIGGAMVARGEGGRIINIASINALVAGQNIGGRHYEAAKAAVVQLTRATAADWAPYGVTANAICPGVFMTEPNQRWARERPEVIEGITARTPMGVSGEPEDLGPLAVYLASDASRFMTGAVLVIDGGYTLW